MDYLWRWIGCKLNDLGSICFWFCDFINWSPGMCFRLAIWALQVSLIMQLLGPWVKGSASSFGFLSRDFDLSGFLMAACCRAITFTRSLFWLVPWTNSPNSGDGSLGYCLCKALAKTSLDSALKLWLGTKGDGLRIELFVFVGQDSRRFLLTHTSHTFCRLIKLGGWWEAAIHTSSTRLAYLNSPSLCLGHISVWDSIVKHCRLALCKAEAISRCSRAYWPASF